MKLHKSLIICLLFVWNYSNAQENYSARVVVISLDGAADYILDDLLARKVLPEDGALSKMSKKGIRAKALIPVNLAATAVAHTALYTGASPGNNGIIGNNFLMQGDTMSYKTSTSGFNAPVMAETLWSAAIRQGKKVVNVNTVGVDGGSLNRKGTKTISYGERIANSIVQTLVPIKESKKPSLEGKFENTMKLDSKDNLSYQLQTGKKIPVFAWAIDDLFDGKENYSGVLLDFDEDISNGYAAILRDKQWSEIKFKVNDQNVSSWSYLINFDPAETSTLYLGSLGYNKIYPQEFKHLIESEVGNWPDEQDNRKLSQGIITEQMWLEQAERLAIHYKNQISKAIAANDWNLLSGYFTLIDDVQHRFLLKHERQLDFYLEDGQRKERYDKYIEWSYKTIDELLTEIINKAPKDINFMIISDHGMAPVHSVLLINNFLSEKGFKTGGEDLEVHAYSTGPAAHIYVNVAGRQGNGTIAEEYLPEYVDKIVEALETLKDPITHQPIFEVVLKNSELNKLNLNHPGRSGDVFISAKTGWSISSKTVKNLPYIIPNSYQKDAYQNLAPEIQKFLASGFMNETGLGVHGNLGSMREMHAILYAMGPNIPNRSLGEVSALDIAPTLAALLEIDPPKNAEGKIAFKKG